MHAHSDYFSFELFKNRELPSFSPIFTITFSAEQAALKYWLMDQMPLTTVKGAGYLAVPLSDRKFIYPEGLLIQTSLKFGHISAILLFCSRTTTTPCPKAFISVSQGFSISTLLIF